LLDKIGEFLLNEPLRGGDFLRKDQRDHGWGLAKTATMRNVEIVINEGSLGTLI
jgi:hypothetical protein